MLLGKSQWIGERMMGDLENWYKWEPWESWVVERKRQLAMCVIKEVSLSAGKKRRMPRITVIKGRAYAGYFMLSSLFTTSSLMLEEFCCFVSAILDSFHSI